MQADWKQLYTDISDCKKCPLCEGRQKTVIGEGDINADVMFIGEGPGKEEDLSGRPFVGPAGRLLDKMLAAIKLERREVYICNIIKCRPPNNRVPTEAEANICLNYLRAQFALVKPKIVVCLGATAAKYIYCENVKITADRGKWINKKGVWILPTYHPAALLRDQSKKQDAWEDLKKLRERMDFILEP